VFQQSIKEQVTNLLKNAQKTHINIKFNFEQFCNYVLIKENEDYCQINLKSFKTKMQILNQTMCANGSLSKIIDDLYDYINNEMSEFQERDSGWSLIEIWKYQPIRGSNCIPLPNHLANRKA